MAAIGWESGFCLRLVEGFRDDCSAVLCESSHSWVQDLVIRAYILSADGLLPTSGSTDDGTFVPPPPVNIAPSALLLWTSAFLLNSILAEARRRTHPILCVRSTAPSAISHFALLGVPRFFFGCIPGLFSCRDHMCARSPCAGPCFGRSATCNNRDMKHRQH